MSGPLDTDPETVSAGADQLLAATGNVRAVFERFSSEVTAHAEAFGGDDIGMLLGIAHQACLDAVAECMTTNIIDLEDYSASLHQMAENLRAAEQAGADLFTAIIGRLG
ncbi:hypothetical protein [Actinoplanes subglobosus]|uniref:Uncharacterized protein n=1 Tax=Actinoplanes subglobosus TaxID=1547892 RepID=A0ABV8J1B5_9ACTN